MITDYDIIRGQVGNGFETRVDERIKLGWQPYGSPNYNSDRVNGIVVGTSAIQAMVKYSPKDNNLTSHDPRPEQTSRLPRPQEP